MSKTLRTRAVTMVGAFALAVGAAVVAPAAAPATPSNLGTIAFTPSSGDITDPSVTPSIAASAQCPTGTGTVFVQINGAGWDGLSVGYGILVGSAPIATATRDASTGGKPKLPLPETLAQIAKDVSVTWAAGDYAVKMVCVDSTTLDSAGVAVFTTNLHFSDATHWTAGSVPVVKPVIKLKKAPALVGTFKVGKKVTVTKGTWSVSRIVFHYQWLRDGKSIRHATKVTYVLTKFDKGHRVTCRIIVTRSGFTSGQSTPRAKKVA